MTGGLQGLIGALEGLGPACGGAFPPSREDRVPPLADGSLALTSVLLGWTGSVQRPVFAASPEANDGLPDRSTVGRSELSTESRSRLRVPPSIRLMDRHGWI